MPIVMFPGTSPLARIPCTISVRTLFTAVSNGTFFGGTIRKVTVRWPSTLLIVSVFTVWRISTIEERGTVAPTDV